MIREATIEDIPALSECAANFQAECPDTYSYDRFRVADMIRECILSSDRCVFVLDVDGKAVGGIIGMLSLIWTSGEIVASELAWFTNKEHRGLGGLKLLRAYEDWAESNDVDLIVVADITGVTDLSALYARRGYTRTETTYSKRGR